jgi:hypothetical protein
MEGRIAGTNQGNGRSIAVTVARTADGRYLVEVLGDVTEADSLDDLMATLRQKLDSTYSGELSGIEVTLPSDDALDAEFERDLDYLLAKNAELYRRLAR